MKRIICILCFLFFLPAIEQIYAHSGRTDSSGGHNCSDTSISKGLCEGYHYHNGGNSSSTQTEAPAANINEKDCSDFATYEEVVDYWNKKGYSASNDPENLDGWGNGVVDDGIPCEPPSDYDKTKINNSKEQLVFKQEQVDRDNGKKEGYTQGKEDGYSGKQDNAEISSQSELYKEGYKEGYQAGFKEGENRITSEKSAVFEEGYELGKGKSVIQIPELYTSNPMLVNAFQEGFDKAVQEKTEAKKKEYRSQGYEEGLEDVHNPPSHLEDQLIQAYIEGYEEAQGELQEKYLSEGYEDAFTQLQYSIPNLGNEKFIMWYKEGFYSNTEVQKIREAAKELGESGGDYAVPSSYKKGEIIYKHFYQLGYDKYVEAQKEKKAATNTATTGIGLTVLMWLGRRFYVAKKMLR